MINLSSNGNYWVQACGSTESYTVSGCLGDPCDNQGGDSDGDGVCDNQDNCDFTYNPNQADSDGDGIGDACDNPCDNQGGDSDGDGVCDNQDNCDFTYNPNQADSDGDGIGDACDSAAPCTPSQLAHWNFNNCDAISGSTANNYNEFIGSTNNGSCSNVSVTNVYRNSPSTNPHSCTEGLNGTEAICVSSKTGCSFSDNNSKAVRFEVTISPSGGQEASLSSLQFYEQAPNYYSWTGGSSGLNNRPTKYGIRVTKNGQEIYKQVDISTTTAYTLENFDFSNNPDFTVSSTTTFQFELLAYCTVNNGSSVTAWDLEDLKVFGCCATNDPCAGQGGDSDGDGVCDNQDNCDFTYNPNQADSDGDGIGDACDTPPSCSVSIGQCSVTISGLGASDNAKVFDSSWNVIWQCHPWGSGTACSATEVINLPSNGNYWVQACGSTESYTVSGCLGDPCANQGGDSDGDGVCDNQDNCDFTYNPNQADSDGDGIGDACDTVDPCANQGGDSDGDGVCDYQDNCDFTYNPNQADSDGDGIGDACDQSPACNVSTGNCSITITGLSGSDNAKVFDSGWNVVWLCDPWGNGSCSSTETISNLSNGTYWVQACGSTIAYTISGCNTDPCANQGGDSDGDGVCDNQDNCDFTYNPNQADSDGDGIGDACDTVDPCANQGGDSDGDGVCDYQDNCDYTYNPNQADSDGDGIGDACDQGPACNVSTGNCSITITGLSGSDNAKVFDAGWNVVWLCDPWGSGSCSSTETITNLSNGTYWVQACGSTTAYTISGCTTATCTPGEIAHWDMDACESSSSNGTNMDYSEFTANTNTPSGFSNVSASLLTHDGGHSCTYGQSGAAICSGIRDNCSWQDNSNDAFRFSVTVNPVNGGTVSLTKLQFYERAPLTYSHINGSSGDNDPPSHYGFRVLKNGYEIYQSTGHNTTQSWSLEQLDLTNDPDFVVTSQTTFEFELLGYCRSNGTSGLAIWDLDEIKVMACAGDGYNSPYQAEEGEDLYFQAQKDGRDVSLYWVTNTDYKNDYFEVERSYDGSNFELIEEVMSISESTDHMGYNEYDPNAKVGTNFYRIKQIFNDGSFIYSAVKQVNFDIDVYEFTVFPNPATDEVFVNLKDFVGNTGTIQLHNSLGQTLQTIDLGVISEHPIRIDIKDYKAGMHAISVHLDGRKVMTEMLVISKL